MDAGVARAGRAGSVLVDRLHQGVALLRGFRHARAGKPEHHRSELHEDFIERPIDFADLIHDVAPPKEGSDIANARSAVPGLVPNKPLTAHGATGSETSKS